MPVKMIGSQYKQFMIDNWGPDPLIEEETVTVDGQEVDNDSFNYESLADNAKVVLTGGWIILDQKNPDSRPIRAETFAKKWLLNRSHVPVVILVERDQEEQFRAFVRDHFPSAKIQ